MPQAANGLDEKHQEKLQSRLRGAGTHRSTFRGFKITLTDKNTPAPGSKDAGNLSTGNAVLSERRRSRRKHQSPPIDSGSTATATLKTVGNHPPPGITSETQSHWGRKGKASVSNQRPTAADARSAVPIVGAAQKRGIREEEEEDDQDQIEEYAGTHEIDNGAWTNQDFTAVHDFEDADLGQSGSMDDFDTTHFESAQLSIRKRGVSRPLPTTPTKKRRVDTAQVVPTSPSAHRSGSDDAQTSRMPTSVTQDHAQTNGQPATSKAKRPEKSSRKAGAISASKARATTSESVVPSSPVTRSKTRSTLVQTQLSAVRPATSDSRARSATLQYVVPNIEDDDEIFALPKKASKGGKKTKTRSSTKTGAKDKSQTSSRRQGKGKGKAKRQGSDSSDEDSGSDGEYGKPVKMYRQLQIQCLKFFGPSTSASRPAQLSNLDKAKQAAVDGEERPEYDQENVPRPPQTLTQSILQFETAPLSEMDVIAEAVRAVADQFIDSIQDEAMALELGMFRANLETLLIEQVDLQDDHALLRSSVKKASQLKKELRSRLLAAQRQHQAAREQLERVRADFERQERVRRRVEETHLFLNNLETMCHGSHQVDIADDADPSSLAVADILHEDGVLLKLQTLVATVAARSGAGGGSSSHDSSMISQLRDFNRILENVDQAVRDYKPDDDLES
ncbi:hypothetical protein BGW42_004177 [Actinomortierella wolfii]|nr:hypothetical protein BGW42_004177 [Actinomortierella wolfii]